jgi:hypothetical protein
VLLLLDAMAEAGPPFFREPVTPVRTWLHQQLRVYADEMAMPPVAAVAVFMMQGAAGSPQAAVRERFVATFFVRLRAALALATAEGELEMTADPQDVLALLGGPILNRTCMEAGTVSDDLIDRLMDSLGTWHPRRTGNPRGDVRTPGTCQAPHASGP